MQGPLSFTPIGFMIQTDILSKKSIIPIRERLDQRNRNVLHHLHGLRHTGSDLTALGGPDVRTSAV